MIVASAGPRLPKNTVLVYIFEGVCKLLLQVRVMRASGVLRPERSRRARPLYPRGAHHLCAIGSVYLNASENTLSHILFLIHVL